MLLEFSQALLLVTTALVTLATIAYLGAVFAARMSRNSVVATAESAGTVVVSTGVGDQTVTVTGGIRHTPVRRFTITWWATKSTQLALVLLTVSMIARMITTGHAPFSNHYEFAIAFAWGMILAQVYFEARYRVRMMSIIVLPIILAMLVYASTLSYEPSPLMPALQNSPLLTLHVITASIGYGAAVVSFAAAVMYLLAPHISWKGWPRQEILDDLGYKATVVTFPMLTMMLILGSIWGNVAWGRYWGWDPKETAALVTWLIYGAYLHARVTRNWRGSKSAWLLVLGFAAVVFTYLGNLFFGGLHAYA
ncbi:cytochrome c-type biogenesis protein CcsB [Propionibacterium sp. oral taxon 192 str. F0372]|uniref:c-type cytochrome biogenesis protein CcsB n=1 Tax=Propionibacterium sp. oral taxon 192 TaxID=671222 RepID=UPI0003538968|nr:c-type cytochrome biogenesis protein CcsB [Propionibacterium sp. oral taxon 192]EPH03458.1 cytochrome c-type biogenesis protein CcsB [Propionibacterium sp. oral taxon 192 str. F0372]